MSDKNKLDQRSQEASPDQTNPPQIVIEFQGVSKEVMAQVWEQLKSGAMPEGAAFTLARSMVDHQHWYAFYETIGIFETGEDQYPGHVDPFLHVNLHFLIGLQILNAAPAGAQKFYAVLEARGEEPHEIVHIMMEAFQKHLVWTAVHGGPEGQFDMNAYEATLEVLAPLEIEEIWEKLGHEDRPKLHPEAYEHSF
jgi:hypothetical protein